MTTITEASIQDVLKAAGFGTLGENPPPEAVEAVLRTLTERLNGSDPLRRQVARQAAVEALKDAGIGAPTKIVDAALKPEPGDGTRASDDGEPAGIVDTVIRPDGSMAWLVCDDAPVITEDHQGATPWPVTRLPYRPAPADVVEAALAAGAPSPLEDVRDLIASAVVLPDPEDGYTTLLATWVLGTYLLPAWDYFPILLLEGPPERGKTRLGKAVTYMARRGYTTPTPRGPTLVRDRAYHTVTLMLDVEDLPGVLQRGGELGDLILASFERGAKVRLVVHPDAPPAEQIESYSAYGATICISNKAITASSPLASRTLSVTLPEAGRVQVPPATRPEHVDELRGRIAAWAARVLAGDLIPDTVDMPLTGRARDLAGPLLRTLAVAGPDRSAELVEMLRSLDADRRSEAASSWEARVAVALWEMRDQVQAGRIYVEDVTDHVNIGVAASEHLTPQQVGYARKNLGLGNGRGGPRGTTYIPWPGDAVIRALYDRYHVPTEDPPENPSEPSEPSGGVSEHSEDNGQIAEHLHESVQGRKPSNSTKSEGSEHSEQFEAPLLDEGDQDGDTEEEISDLFGGGGT